MLMRIITSHRFDLVYKQDKSRYHQILAELDLLNSSTFYETFEISVLGHYQ